MIRRAYLRWFDYADEGHPELGKGYYFGYRRRGSTNIAFTYHRCSIKVRREQTGER